MKRQQSFQNNQPTLYLVATPIGNLDEMTPRAIDILKKVDVIAAEDTRQTMKLMSHFQIGTRMVSHHEHNEMNSAKGLIKMLSENLDVALVSDAGYPLLCDPGSILVKEVLDAGYNVVTISGSNALLNALVASGITSHPFYFHGFLNHNNSYAKRELKEMQPYPMTLVLYESVHRLERTLMLLLEILGDREICVARELTKQYEEYLRGTISEMIPVANDLKGEFVLVVEGCKDRKPDINIADINLKVQEYIAEGYSASEAIKMVAKEENIAKNDVYRLFHQA